MINNIIIFLVHDNTVGNIMKCKLIRRSAKFMVTLSIGRRHPGPKLPQTPVGQIHVGYLDTSILQRGGQIDVFRHLPCLRRDNGLEPSDPAGGGIDPTLAGRV